MGVTVLGVGRIGTHLDVFTQRVVVLWGWTRCFLSFLRHCIGSIREGVSKIDAGIVDDGRDDRRVVVLARWGVGMCLNDLAKKRNSRLAYPEAFWRAGQPYPVCVCFAFLCPPFFHVTFLWTAIFPLTAVPVSSVVEVGSELGPCRLGSCALRFHSSLGWSFSIDHHHHLGSYSIRRIRSSRSRSWPKRRAL